MHSILRSKHGKDRVSREPCETASTCRKNLRSRTRARQALSFLSHQNDRHGVSLFLRSSICWRTSDNFRRQFFSFLCHPRSSFRIVGSTFHSTSGVVSFSPFRRHRLIFFHRFSKVRRWLEPLRSMERRDQWNSEFPLTSAPGMPRTCDGDGPNVY